MHIISLWIPVCTSRYTVVLFFRQLLLYICIFLYILYIVFFSKYFKKKFAISFTISSCQVRCDLSNFPLPLSHAGELLRLSCVIRCCAAPQSTRQPWGDSQSLQSGEYPALAMTLYQVFTIPSHTDVLWIDCQLTKEQNIYF